MSENRYFEKFPTIQYSNSNVVDITKRATMLESVSGNPYIFYPYELSIYERPDQFSARYFEDPQMSWILYLSNKIVDPYYEWYLTAEQFHEFLGKKYQKHEYALRKVKYYRNDWYNSKDITPSKYDSLTPLLKSYWKPVYTSYNKFSTYTRKQNNSQITTNKIVSCEVSDSNNFIKDEICKVYFDSENIGKGQISYSTDGKLYLQHISGYFLSNNEITGSSYVYGEESQVNTSLISTTLVKSNLRPEEEIYWAPVTYAEYENEKNEYNKSIRVLDRRISSTMTNNLRDIMKV